MARVAWDRWPPAADPHTPSPPGEGGQGADAAGAHTRSTRSYLYLRQLGALAIHVHSPTLDQVFLQRPTAKGCHAVKRPGRQPLGEGCHEGSDTAIDLIIRCEISRLRFLAPAGTHPSLSASTRWAEGAGRRGHRQRRGYAKDLCSRLLQTSSTAPCGSEPVPDIFGFECQECSKALR